ncbi:MAG: hypothetical protein M0T75_05820 [Chloroflexi bacterium]|nr:hypothetical protein [Chloroflexota bacterium]
MVFLVALGLLMAALFLVASGIVGILAWAGLLDLSDYPLELAPGESARVDVAGPAVGIVAAAFGARATAGGETVGVVLRAPFRPTAARPGGPLPVLPITLGVASFLAALAALWAVRRRVRP